MHQTEPAESTFITSPAADHPERLNAISGTGSETMSSAQSMSSAEGAVGKTEVTSSHGREANGERAQCKTGVFARSVSVSEVSVSSEAVKFEFIFKCEVR